jgi:hypothetical protein
MSYLIGLALLAATSGPGEGFKFPVARAESEFKALIPHVDGYCGPRKGDLEGFRRAVLPYGPLDLSVLKGRPQEAEGLRNLYLGIVGAACGIDSAALARTFDCGDTCLKTRRGAMVGKLSEIKEVVDAFRSLRGIRLVSQWGIVDEYRVNDLFVMMGQMNEAVASPRMGFVPSRSWRHVDSLAAYLKPLNVREEDFLRIVQKAKALSLSAIVREAEGVRAISVGIGDKESGLLFLSKGALPKVGKAARDGRKYVIVEPIEPGVVFYETD